MKEAIQQYIKELHNKVKDFKEGRETDDPQYIGEYTSLINETLRTIGRLEEIVNCFGGGEDKKPLTENDLKQTEENDNWRLTKYPL